MPSIQLDTVVIPEGTKAHNREGKLIATVTRDIVYGDAVKAIMHTDFLLPNGMHPKRLAPIDPDLSRFLRDAFQAVRDHHER